MVRFIRDRYVWYTAVLLAIVTIFTYLVEPNIFGETFEESEWHAISVIIRNVIFLGIVTVSAWKFGLKRGLVICLAVGFIPVPHIVDETLVEAYHPGVLLEYIIFIPIGVVITWLLGAYKQIENKRADLLASLHETNEDLEVAQRLTRMGNWKWVIASNTVIWSKELCQINGWDPNVPVPPFAEMERFYTPGSWKRLNELVARALNTGESYEAELEQIRTDGTKITTFARGEVNYDAKGTLIDLHGSVQDITERKKAEETIKLQSELLDKELDSVYLSDFEGNLLYVNKAAYVTHGYTREELLSMTIKNLDDTESAKLIAPRLKEIFEKGELTFEVNHRHKNGSLIPLEIHASKIGVGGKQVILSVAHDITERRKVQQQLMAQDRLASIGQLVSGVAHELNNPLTSVIGFSELLLQRELPDDVKADLKIVNDEAKRTSLIVKNLLTFARQQPQEKRAIDINEPIKTVLQLRSHEQTTNNIKVNAYLAPDLPQIMGNASQLQQVFFNIVTNAEQAMLEAHNKGILTITTEQIGNFIRASFSDDGPGISPENMARLFSPFFTTKEIGKGTGLGLSICQGIITEHNGRIWAESEPGKGATFIIELPTL